MRLILWSAFLSCCALSFCPQSTHAQVHVGDVDLKVGLTDVAVNPVTGNVYVLGRGGEYRTGTFLFVVDGKTLHRDRINLHAVPINLAVDSTTNRIYVFAQAGNLNLELMAIDGQTNKTLANVILPGCGGQIIPDDQRNQVYVLGDFPSQVCVVDLATQTVTTVPTGNYPEQMAFNPATGKLYVANYDSNSVTVINCDDFSTVTVPVGSAPSYIAVNTVTNLIYVGNTYPGSITVINGVNNETSSIPVAYMKGLATDSTHNRVFALGYAALYVIDGAQAQKTITLTVGGNPANFAVDPVTNEIYVQSPQGSCKTIDGDTLTVASWSCASGADAVAVDTARNRIYLIAFPGVFHPGTTLQIFDGAANHTSIVGAGARPFAAAANPATHQVYVANKGDNTVTVIDGQSLQTNSIPVGKSPVAVAADADSNMVYVANAGDGTVTAINGATNQTSSIAVGKEPVGVAIHEPTKTVFVANYRSNNVTAIDEETGQTHTLRTGSGPIAVASLPSTDEIYVANRNDGTVTVIKGSTGARSTVTVGEQPSAIATDPTGRKAYVVNTGSDNVTVIDGLTHATTTVSVGKKPVAIVFNSAARAAYVSNSIDDTVTKIDAATLETSVIGLPASPDSLSVNEASNKIYVTSRRMGFAWAIDGPSNTPEVLTPPAEGRTVAVDPVLGQAYFPEFNGTVFVVTEQNATSNPLQVSVQPLMNNETTSRTPTFNFTLQDLFEPYLPPGQVVLYQVDSAAGEWHAASGAYPDYSGTTAPLTLGTHILYMMAGDSQFGANYWAWQSATYGVTSYVFIVVPEK